MKTKYIVKLLNYLKILIISGLMFLFPNSNVAKEKVAVSDNKINSVKTWVFVVGVLEWEDSKNFSSFPKENRRDASLVNYFKSIGVSPSQIIYLQDKSATSNNIQKSMIDLLKQTNPEDFLFLYYCGHGYEQGKETFFASYDASKNIDGWKVSSIFSTIEEYFNGNKVFLTADCCYSGALVKNLENYKSKISYASLTSSDFNESSTGNWTFSDCLLDALSGEHSIDINNDGQINLEELAAYTKMDMLFGENQHAQFVTTGTFSPSLALSNSNKKTDSRIGTYVQVKTSNRNYPARIIAVNSSQIKVHYIGYDKTDDEWVNANQIKTVDLTNSSSSKNLTYQIGEKVLVTWKGKKYKAVIKKADGFTYFIHYLNYGDEWDEWVKPNRISRN